MAKLGLESSAALSKRVEDLNGGDVEPGDVLRYTLTARYEEGAGATQVRITDPLPRGLTAVSVLDGGSLISNSILWTLGNLDSTRREVSVRFEATVAPQVTDGERIANQAIARANNISDETRSDDPDTPELSDPTVVIVSSRAQIGIATKRVNPQEARPGDEIEWVIEIENRGPSIARDIVVADPLSEWLVDVVAQGGQIAGGQAIWNIDQLGVNQRRTLTLRTRLRGDVSLDQVVANQAIVTGSNFDEVRTDDPSTPASTDPTVLTILPTPTVRFTKEVRRPRPVAQSGERVTYVLRVINTTVASLNNLVINDQLPAGLRAVNAPEGIITGNTVSWTIAELPEGQERSLTLEVEVNDDLEVGSEILNQATLVAQGGLNVVSDDPITAEPGDPTALRIIGEADLLVLKRVSALDTPPFRNGGRIRYEIELTNRGSADAEQVVIQDPLPPQLENITSVEGQITNRQISWSVPVLAAGASRTLSFEALIGADVSEGTEITNQAQVTWEGTAQPVVSDDPNTPLVDPTRFEVQAGSRLILNKVVAREDGQPDFPAGSVVVYTLTLQNDGAGVSEPQTITDIISPSLRPISERIWTSVSGITAQIQGQNVSWQVPALNTGERVTLIVGALIRDEVIPGAQILNQAESRATSTPGQTPLLSDDPNTPAVPDPTTFTISGRVNLRVEKSIISANSNFAPGGQVEYEITLINYNNYYHYIFR